MAGAFGAHALAPRLGEKTATWVSRSLSPPPHRTVDEDEEVSLRPERGADRLDAPLDV